MVVPKYPTLAQEMQALATDAARADWLMRQSDGVIASYAANIRSAMEAAGFDAALPYLKARISAVWTERTADGSLPQTVLMGLHHAALTMKSAVKASASLAAPAAGNRSSESISDAEGLSATPREGGPTDGGTT